MTLFVELHVALLQREERVIAANADIVARMETRTALSDDDGTYLCILTWETEMHRKRSTYIGSVRVMRERE